MIFVFLFLSSIFAKSSFMVAPSVAELDIRRPQITTFSVVNNGDEKIRIAIDPIYYPIGDNNLPPVKAINPKTANKDDLSKGIRVSPKVLSIRPNETRTIRVSVRPDANLQEGEYRSHLLFKIVETESTNPKNTRNKQKAEKKSATASIEFLVNIAVALYGHIGIGEPVLNVKCGVDSKTGKAKVTLLNNSAWRYDGYFNEERVVMLRDSYRDFILDVTPKAKETKLNFKLKYSDENKTTPINDLSCSY